MVPSLPLLSCEPSVSVKENPDRKKKLKKMERLFYMICLCLLTAVSIKKSIRIAILFRLAALTKLHQWFTFGV